MASNDFEMYIVPFGTQCIQYLIKSLKHLSNKQKKRNIILKIFIFPNCFQLESNKRRNCNNF